jgi:hypothetical protein
VRLAVIGAPYVKPTREQAIALLMPPKASTAKVFVLLHATAFNNLACGIIMLSILLPGAFAMLGVGAGFTYAWLVRSATRDRVVAVMIGDDLDKSRRIVVGLQASRRFWS